jgi:sulfotransferase
MYNRPVGKTFHFLAGLHRSGNTVLSSILNQHPDIYSSPLSPVSEYMWRMYSASNDFQSAKSNMYPERSTRLLSRMLENYYEDVEKPIVFDRDKNWAHPGNIQMMKECLNFKPKIVFTTRPIIEILASFIAIDINTIIGWMHGSGFKIDEKLTLNDNLCDFLMSETEQLPRVLNALSSIDNPENTGMIHVVKYEDLLNTPQETMNGIYDFLEIESFKHNFTNIRKIEEYNESAVGLPKDLHKVRRVLGKSDVRVEDYLTPRSIEKYKDVRYY